MSAYLLTAHLDGNVIGIWGTLDEVAQFLRSSRSDDDDLEDDEDWWQVLRQEEFEITHYQGATIVNRYRYVADTWSWELT